MVDDIERRTMRRVMWRLIPFMGLCFTISWLDRTNLAFAGLQMNAQLGFSATVFGTGAGVFFLGYIICEVPSNILLSRVGARLWIARIMITWGLVAVATAFITGPRSFYLCRFLLGAAEGGFYPGAIYFFSLWTPNRYRARIYGRFGSFGAVALVIAGPLASQLLSLDQTAHLAGWQWLFLLEGLPALLLGIVCLFYLRDNPASVKWLPTDEREWLIKTLESDTRSNVDLDASALKVLIDSRVIILAMCWFAIGLGLYSISLWLPLILKEFRLATTTIGYLTVLPGLAGMLGLLLWPWHADRTRDRRWHLVIAGVLASAGLLIAAWQPNSLLIVMTGMCVTYFGCSSSFPLLVTWPTSALTGTAAASATAMITAVGTSSGYFGSQLVGILRDYTGDFRSAVAVISALVFICPIVLSLHGRFLNESQKHVHRDAVKDAS